MKYVITVENRKGFGLHNNRITKCDKIVKFISFSPTTSGRATTWQSGTAQVILGFRVPDFNRYITRPAHHPGNRRLRPE